MRSFAILALLTTTAAAEPLAVVVRDSGNDARALARLRGQLADLDVTVKVEAGEIEASLEAQLASAARLADADDARVVIWFIAKRGGIAVAIATPGDHRLFVREIPPGNASAVAEAAAIAARGAVRAIALGGTIGVEVKAAQPAPDEVGSAPVQPFIPQRDDDGPHASLEASIGWQAAIDGGADRGAHALAQRTTIARGAWAGSLALAIGVPARRDGEVAIELARSGAMIGFEYRFGSIALGATAGALLYRRSTIATAGLDPTPASSTYGFVAGPEASWRWRSHHFGIAATLGLDIVANAPDPAVSRAGMVESLGALTSLQPRISVSILAGLP